MRGRWNLRFFVCFLVFFQEQESRNQGVFLRPRGPSAIFRTICKKTYPNVATMTAIAAGGKKTPWIPPPDTQCPRPITTPAPLGRAPPLFRTICVSRGVKLVLKSRSLLKPHSKVHFLHRKFKSRISKKNLNECPTHRRPPRPPRALTPH